MTATKPARIIAVAHGGVHLVVECPADRPAALLHMGLRPFDDAVPERHRWAYRMVELRAAGEDHDYIAAGRSAGTALGGRLRYRSHRDEAVPEGRRLTLVQSDPETGIEATVALTIGSGVVVWRTSVRNAGTAVIVLLDMSGAFVAGLAKGGNGPRGERLAVHVPRSGWYAEFQWSRRLAGELGLNTRFAFGSRHETVRSVGSWCSGNHLPMGYLEHTETGDGLLFEILHGGSWSWQVGETAEDFYLHVAGPGEAEGWWRTLAPGAEAEAPPVAFAPALGFDDAMAAMTRHRRDTRRVGDDGAPIVFNDYMNCLMGDPTEDAVLPLIDVAADLGAEVYCIDAGWYARPGERWSFTLGRWEVNRDRFPNGLSPVIARIRERGMVPGLWFEIEGMTANCPGFAELPDDWFFIRHGRRVVSHRRYQLDFRNPAVRAFATAAIEAAVTGLGVGFLKLDYNFSSGIGSDLGAESPGQALVDYEAAYLAWLDELRARHPRLMIEHCASGGQRLARPYLDRTHHASNSDEGDPLQIARIAAAAPTILLPEQNGTWALPNPAFDAEMTAFAMLCALPFRVLLAGGAQDLSDEQRALVREAVELHKDRRRVFATAVPCWPLGLPAYADPWLCVGLKSGEQLHLAIWRRDGGLPTTRLEFPDYACAQVLYPAALPTRWSFMAGTLEIDLPERSGRLFLLRAG